MSTLLPAQAVILDWAGTVIDCGVFSPVVVFKRGFEAEGVPVTDAEARGPMGTHKKEHIRRYECMPPLTLAVCCWLFSKGPSGLRLTFFLFSGHLLLPSPLLNFAFTSRSVTQMQSVRQRWLEKHGRYPNEEDVDRMFKRFVPHQLEVLRGDMRMIHGAVDTVKHLQKVCFMSRRCNEHVGSWRVVCRRVLSVVADERWSRCQGIEARNSIDIIQVFLRCHLCKFIGPRP